MRFSYLVVVLLLCVGCGGSPTGPDPIPQPTTVTISGRITTTLTGEPVAASLNFSGRIVTAGSDGRWTLDGQNANATLPVEITASGYLTRTTTIKTENGRSDVTVDLIRDGGSFSLAFYRQMIRNGFDAPANVGSEPLRGWRRNPNFYIQTLNPKTGTAITAPELASIEATIRSVVPQATGGALSVASITSELETHSQADTVSIAIEYNPSGDFCGSALVGGNPGQVTLNYDRCGCSGLAISPETVAHEIGHSMGLRHTNGGGIMDNNRVRSCTNTTFSASELYHARIAYARQPGNMDIDRDASGFAFLAPSTRAPIVQCFRR